MKTLRSFFLIMLSVLMLLCMGSSSGAAQETTDDFEDEQPEIWDPIEPVNRGIFWFNDTFDVYVAEPVARGYKYVVPEAGRTGLRNFFNNLAFPIYFINDLLQFRFGEMATHTQRFVINSTLGLAGFIDVAKECGVEYHDNDFGLTLARWGSGPGPYLVLPFLGPSNLRDGIGIVADGFADPVYYINYTDASDGAKWGVSVGVKSLQFINTRARLLEAIESAKESSLDYYLFMQGAYYQYREGLLREGKAREMGIGPQTNE